MINSKKFNLMKRFANDLVAATVILSVLLPLLAVPVIATITNEGVKQLTTEPWDSKYFSWRQYAFSWSPDSTKIAYFSLENIFQE